MSAVLARWRQRPKSGRSTVAQIVPLGVGHGVVDLFHGAVPAVLPFLVTERGLGFGQVGGLLAATSGIAALGQLVVGVWVDRHGTRWLAPASVLLAAAGLATLGLVNTYISTVLALAVVGVGVAAFHPPAYLALRNTVGSRSTPVGLFAVAGNAGLAVGPLLTAALLAHLGLTSMPLLFIPALVAAALLVVRRRQQTAAAVASAPKTERALAAHGNDRRAFAVLTAVTLGRSIVFVAVEAFIALYAVHRFGFSPAAADAVLTLFLAIGVAGSFLGGISGDTCGRTTTLRIAFAVGTVGLAILSWTNEPLTLLGGLVAVGLGIYMPFSVELTLAQDYLPTRPGLASAVALGLSGGAGALATPALGILADTVGLRAVFALAVGVCVVTLALTAVLPEPRSTRAAEHSAHPSAPPRQ